MGAQATRQTGGQGPAARLKNAEGKDDILPTSVGRVFNLWKRRVCHQCQRKVLSGVWTPEDVRERCIKHNALAFTRSGSKRGGNVLDAYFCASCSRHLTAEERGNTRP